MLSLFISDLLLVAFPLFGGCCLNVFVLEQLLANSSHPLGTAITFAQFLFIAVASWPSQIDPQSSSWKRLWLPPSHIPIHKWFYYVVMFFTVSLLNNLVLKYNISIPLHTIFRSSSTVITMAVGYLFGGKCYNRGQVLSCLIMSLGAILATFRSGSGTSHANSQFVLGVVLLIALSILASLMSLYNESLFRQYGNHWQESLFYTHFLGLPLFLLVGPDLKREFLVIWNDQKVYEIGQFSVKKQAANLLINMVSQYVCIRSVSKLAGKTLALTVSIVLLVRKFVSLIISVVWFGNAIGSNGAWGAVLVFVGTVYYALASGTRPSKKAPIQDKSRKDVSIQNEPRKDLPAGTKRNADRSQQIEALRRRQT
ncbi:golgi uridine diphosphate-N acetylglucosamine transporter [Suhomyces tanzawaensis NRRL Y-17324]|uniref:Golgi uridine diphosphate-N acetylglucosamine transporter n=1 Tax=Suhomyces tanzawaensis NRRL Y-17324 TaxID=984487 RepID=A0A1E4SS75_9ASCO|nr:golgi uridine diphosphate-N acetylglucosamine transporter [Suhomyces tanzawaensis NRRL Y-17324]ODV82351.1 golgi uridine diphosphate-N acetylglucosamine transporter [Suhomyces tanzawaensis NRRL Y-17324]